MATHRGRDGPVASATPARAARLNPMGRQKSSDRHASYDAAPKGNESLSGLIAAVQTNCDIADARHATDLTLCTYLLQMREFHRWERGLAFGAALDRTAVGLWIDEREARWDSLEGRDFEPLPIGKGMTVDAYDVCAVNAQLATNGLLYGAGELAPGRPVFFLAERHSDGQRLGLPVQVAGRELARGLQAPVATFGGADAQPTIVVRRESLARWCWERFEAFSLKPTAGSPFHAVVQAYGLDVGFDAALPRWLQEQTEAAILHELGEAEVGRRLGPAWAAMRQALPSRRGMLYVRALRDLLADLHSTLPTLLDRRAEASIHVWFANLDGVRSLLAPGLPPAYAAWREGDGGKALGQAIGVARVHFERLAESLLARHRAEGDGAGPALEQALQSPAAVWRGANSAAGSGR